MCTIVIAIETILNVKMAFLLYNIGKKGGRQNVTFHYSVSSLSRNNLFRREKRGQQKKERRTRLRGIFPGKREEKLIVSLSGFAYNFAR